MEKNTIENIVKNTVLEDKNIMLKTVRTKASRLILIQLLIVVLLSILWLIFKNFKAGYSTLLGGLACIIPSWYFIYKLFKNKQRTPAMIIKDFYIGELMKLLLSTILLILIIKYLSVSLFPTITGFIAAYLSIWFMPLMFM